MKTKALGKAFLTVKVPEGKHKITLIYVSPGFKEGAILSIVGFVIFLLLLYLFRKKKISNIQQNLTENYGTFHATCEGDTNWAAFAEAIFKRAGKTTKVNHVTSEQYAKMNPASANRPAYSILENYMMKLTDGYKMAEWQDALDEYMKTLE